LDIGMIAASVVLELLCLFLNPGPLVKKKILIALLLKIKNNVTDNFMYKLINRRNFVKIFSLLFLTINIYPKKNINLKNKKNSIKSEKIDFNWILSNSD